MAYDTPGQDSHLLEQGIFTAHPVGHRLDGRPPRNASGSGRTHSMEHHAHRHGQAPDEASIAPSREATWDEEPVS
jgi:hypothetical protein